MPTPRLIQIQAWSYSRLSTYNQCPLKAKLQCIDKLREPDSKAGLNGTRVHAIAAAIATGHLPTPDKDNRALLPELAQILKAKGFPSELETFKEDFKALRKMKPIAESEWAFDKEWQPCSWFAGNCWLRIKVDLHFVSQVKVGKLHRTRVTIKDWKTGKWSADHALQRELYALGAFLQYQDCEEVVAQHCYLDLGKEEPATPLVWTRDQLPKLKKTWLDRTTAMLNDTTFAPTPSDKCRWCHFRAANTANGGGQCEF